MKENMNDLHTFIVVAQERSFTRAAAKLRISQSAISQTLRNLEDRIGIKLLSRTTRSVAPTEAGEYLLSLIQPAIEEIEHGMNQLSALKNDPAGTLRISADEYGIQTVLWPAVEKVIQQFRKISVEITSDYGLVDIVDGRFDAGLRRGGLVSKDMIALQISEPIQMLTVATKEYLERYGHPKQPKDLVEHRCINLRIPTRCELYRWQFTKGNKTQSVNVNAKIVFTTLSPVLQAVRSGVGIAYLPIDMVQPYIESGELKETLKDWRHSYEPYHLYYPHRREQAPLLNILINALKENFNKV